MLLEEGNPIRLTAELVSLRMLRDGVEISVSRTAVKSLIDRLNPITNIVKSRGQWSDNHEAWVKARYNWTIHFLVRLDETYQHKSVKQHLKKYGSDLPDWLNRSKLEAGGYTFSKHQICWYDECHVYQQMGPESPIQYRFKWSENGNVIPNISDDYADITDDALASPTASSATDDALASPIAAEKEVSTNEIDSDNEDDADDEQNLVESQKWHTTKSDISKQYRDEDHVIKFKFQQQARFMFGVALIEKKKGEPQGIRLPMTTYNGKKIVGMGKWDQGVSNAIELAKKSKSERTWTTKNERPEGKELYEEDSVTVIRGIGKKSERILHEASIFKVSDCIKYPEKLNELNGTNHITSMIKSKIETALVGLGINKGKCPKEYEFIDHRKADNPYESKYGDESINEISKSSTLKLVRPVSDLINHMAVESTEIMKDTIYKGKALFYHDALSQLTEKRTVEWMKNNKIGERQIYDLWIKPVLDCNNEIVLRDGTVNKNYAGRPVGNSPEFMPLDNSLNQDIHCAARAQVSATRFLPKDHPQRFSMATPQTITHVYGSCHCPRYDRNSAIPTDDRIAQDINKVFFSLLTIMEANGKVVPGLASRVGHRAYINSLSVEQQRICIEGADEFLDESNENERESEESEPTKQKAKKSRWFHPDTCDVLQNRWKDQGNEEEKD